MLLFLNCIILTGRKSIILCLCVCMRVWVDTRKSGFFKYSVDFWFSKHLAALSQRRNTAFSSTSSYFGSSNVQHIPQFALNTIRKIESAFGLLNTIDILTLPIGIITIYSTAAVFGKSFG